MPESFCFVPNEQNAKKTTCLFNCIFLFHIRGVGGWVRLEYGYRYTCFYVFFNPSLIFLTSYLGVLCSTFEQNSGFINDPSSGNYIINKVKGEGFFDKQNFIFILKSNIFNGGGRPGGHDSLKAKYIRLYHLQNATALKYNFIL